MFSLINKLRSPVVENETENKPDEEVNKVEKPVNRQLELQEDQSHVVELLKSILGSISLKSDVLSGGISLPCHAYEPMSILQRQTEMLEYSELLDYVVDECTDPLERMVYIAGFTLSGMSATQRFRTDFNPMLGETYEYVSEERGFKFFSEQVSHHPPVSALHTESDKWVFWQNTNPSTSFLGNSLDISTNARTHIYIPSTKDHFYYTNPRTRVHNLIFGGKTWCEHYGELEITNLKNGQTCVIHCYKNSGFFGGSVNYNVDGEVKDASGKTVVKLKGRWDQYLDATWVRPTEDSPEGKEKTVWTIYPDNIGCSKYGLTNFALTLNGTFS